MVRVISAHHFENQTIQTCEDALAIAIAPPSTLLVALVHHVIEVRDLSQSGELLFTFPTIDQAHTLIHCRVGNYVATLEKKKARHGSEASYARVYANWNCFNKNEKAEECGQPIMARIAGKVTPSSSQIKRGSLEMIELPVKYSSTSLIACCQATGNLILGSQKSVSIFQLVTRTHDISRLKFLDFEPSPFNLELSFKPISLSITENIIAAMSSNSVHVFRINQATYLGYLESFKNPFSTPAPDSESGASDDSSLLSDTKVSVIPEVPSTIDLNVFIQSVLNPQNPFEWEHVLHKNSFPVVVQFPSIPSAVDMSDNSNLKSSSFKSKYSVSTMPILNLSNEGGEAKFTTESLLKLELVDMECVLDKLQCLILRPLYQTSNTNPPSDTSSPGLLSEHHPFLVALNCLVCTQQEGFMYHFPVFNEGSKIGEGKCISVYHFTSPVISVALELNLLHALTETGLETYTLRTSHHALQPLSKLDYPPPTDPVSLIGLRPFLGVINLLLSENYLVIVASANDLYENTPISCAWTVYSLQLPTAVTLYSDIIALAKNHRFNGPSNYVQLLDEGHMILAASINLSFSSSIKNSDSGIETEKELFEESCSVLADHLLSSENPKDLEHASTLYTMAKITPFQVMERIKKIEKDAKDAKVVIDLEKGLTQYFKSCLGSWPEVSGESPQVITASLLDFLESSNQVHILPHLILQHSFLREVSLERILNLIKQLKVSQTVDNSSEVKSEMYHEISLTLAVLYLQRGLIDEASRSLNFSASSRSGYLALFLKNPHLLFEKSKVNSTTNQKEFSSFSELTMLLIDSDSTLVCETLLKLVEQKFIDLQIVMKMFLSYLVTCTSKTQVKTSQCLQYFLECYFSSLKSHDNQDSNLVTKEALKILMRSYLSDLKLNSVDKYTNADLNDSSDHLFSNQLPCVLQLLPDSHSKSQNCPSLRKLQSLLVSGWLDCDAVSELSVYVHDVLPDCLSLKILAEPENAVNILFNLCPETLSQYAKDTFKSESEWKILIQKLYEAVKGNKISESSKCETWVFRNLLKEVLEYLALNLSMEEFCKILPPDFDSSFHEFIVRCQNICHANAVRALIITTGHNLLLAKNQ